MGNHTTLASAPTTRAPDGSTVHILLGLDNLTTARFLFPPESVSVALRHRTVSEVWHVVGGTGLIWVDGGLADGIALAPGVSISIELGESFQVRTDKETLVVLGVTTPRWPGEDEVEFVDGPWSATLEPGSA